MEPNLLEALQKRGPSSVSTPCGYYRLLHTMSEEERTAVEAAFSKVLNDAGSGRAKVYSYAWLAEVLKEHSYTISASTLARHARGKCGCE
jgi:hypothetical protein